MDRTSQQYIACAWIQLPELLQYGCQNNPYPVSEVRKRTKSDEISTFRLFSKYERLFYPDLWYSSATFKVRHIANSTFVEPT